MKRLFFYGLTISFQWALFASNVQWDVVKVVSRDTEWRDMEIEANTGVLDISFFICTSTLWNAPSTLVLAATPNNARIGSLAPIESYVSGAWRGAQKGETVNRQTMLDSQSGYLFNETFGSVRPRYENQVFVEYEPDVSQYLKFVTQNAHEVYDYMAGSLPDATTLYYGWVEYVVEDGVFRVLNSAVDYDGDPIIVGLLPGSTPEPSCGMLLLVGVFVSLLKRPRRLAGCGRGESAHGKSVERRVA